VSERPTTRRLVVGLPVDLFEKVHGAAELSHRTVDDFVESVLAHEIARWVAAFAKPDPS
jgi:hypothetical protein